MENEALREKDIHLWHSQGQKKSTAKMAFIRRYNSLDVLPKMLCSMMGQKYY